MNDSYKLLYFGHYDFMNKDNGAHYSGWSVWVLPNFAAGLRDDEYGIRPEKFNLMEDEFQALGGIKSFSELLGKDVAVSFRVRGKSVRIAGMTAIK